MRVARLRVWAARHSARALLALVGAGLVVPACSSGGGPSSNVAEVDSGTPDAAPGGPVDPADADDAYVGTDSAEDASPPRDTACDALVSYWPGEGTAADLTGLHPLSWRPDLTAKSYVQGKFGAAFGFPQSATSYLENQAVNALATTDTLTVAMWWKSSGGRDLLSLESGAKTTLKLTAGYPGMGFTVSIAGETDVTSDPISPAAGTFSHLALTLSKTAGGSSVRFHLNGEPFGPPANLAVPIPAGLFAMGSVLTLGSAGFGGAIDEALLFRRALDDAEIRSIYQRRIYCGAALVPPDAGTEFLRCPAPSPAPSLVCNRTACTSASDICCSYQTGSIVCSSSAACTSAGGVVGLACVKGAECGSGSACCLAGFAENDVSNVSCETVNRVPTTSACKATCAPTELHLCSTTTDCPLGRKCTGFTATISGGGPYPLGACLP